MDPYSIYTDRHFQTWPNRHIIYEWEDEISNLLKIIVYNTPHNSGKIIGKANWLFIKFMHFDLTILKKIKNYNRYFYFEMGPKNFRSFSNQENAIPIIIDFWGGKDTECINKYYKHCPYILISSLEVLNYLKKNNSSLNLIHFPLSLPDKYRLQPNQTFEKQYDIVLAGRTNSILWEYLKKYETTHPNIEYLYQELINGELYYRSNRNGFLDKCQTREEYYKLIRSAKISFFSTPGIDGGEKRTRGFNPVTPRFLELLSAGCHIIARYPQNEESDYYQLNTICPSVNTYKDFVIQMDFALNSNELPIKRNSDYLLKHYTSTRMDILLNVINKI